MQASEGVGRARKWIVKLNGGVLERFSARTLELEQRHLNTPPSTSIRAVSQEEEDSCSSNTSSEVEVKPGDKEKTAFVTSHGLFQFSVRLCNAPATFQRLMEHVLAGLHWFTCLVYLDDIIVFSTTAEEHLERLRTVCLHLK